METFFTWVRNNVKAIAFGLVGMLLGILICAPLIPWVLPDASANVLGATLGAAITVCAAFWISERAELQKIRAARQFVLNTFEQLVAACDVFDRGSSGLAKGSPAEACSEIAIAYCNAHFSTSTTFDLMKPVFQTLGTSGISCHADLTRAMISLEPAHKELETFARDAFRYSKPETIIHKNAVLLSSNARIISVALRRLE